MDKRLNIGVAGAGIGGLAIATLLARQGHQISVFDQFDAPQPVGSGLMLQKTGLAVLQRLGLREDVNALGSRIDRLWGLTTPSLRPVLDVRFQAWQAETYALGVQRGLLFGLLMDAALESGAELRPGVAIRSVDGERGMIEQDNGAEHGPFDLVIDGLGARSVLTRAPRRDLPYGALWATLPWPGGDVFDEHALEQRYHRASKMSGVMGSGRAAAGQPKTLTYFWSIRGDQEADWRQRPLNVWKDEARALWPETAPLLDGITSHDQLTFARYRHRTHPNPISAPRLVHIGDAWHAASPQLGQGANMALLDVWALAEALRAAPTTQDAARRYRALRRGHVRLYQLMTWMFTPVYQGDSRVLPFVRDWLAAPISRIWPAPPLLGAMVAGALGRPLRKLKLEP